MISITFQLLKSHYTSLVCSPYNLVRPTKSSHIPPEAVYIHHNVLSELVSVFERQLGSLVGHLWLVTVHVNDRTVDRLGKVRAVVSGVA